MLLRRVSRWINCSNLSLLMLSIKCHIRDLNDISRLIRATCRNTPYVLCTFLYLSINIYIATRVHDLHLVIIAKSGACHFPFFFRKNHKIRWLNRCERRRQYWAKISRIQTKHRTNCRLGVILKFCTPDGVLFGALCNLPWNWLYNHTREILA